MAAILWASLLLSSPSLQEGAQEAPALKAVANDLQSEVSELRAMADEADEAARNLREASPEERQAYGELRTQVFAKIESFAERHLVGTLTPEVAKVLVDTAEHPVLSALLRNYVSKSLEQKDLQQFLRGCELLAKQGLSDQGLESLDGPRTMAMFLEGNAAEAKTYAGERVAKLGPAGLGFIDVLAAIHASEGDYEKARALYVTYRDEHAPADDKAAYRYASKAEMIGRPAPEIDVASWIGPEGSEMPPASGLSGLAGKVVVLDFWQPWCGPCRMVMPGLSALQKQLADKPFQVLGLCYKDGKAGYDVSEKKSVPKEEIEGEKYVHHVREFSKEMGLSYIVGVAEERTNNDAYGIRGIPTLVVVDPKGVVAWINIGSSPGVDRMIGHLAAKLIENGGSSGGR